MLLLHFFLSQKFENVAGLGDPRKIELRLDLCRSGPLPGRCRAGPAHKIFPDLFRFVDFNGTGMGLLFRYANLQQHIQDSFALYFKLPGQIIDSNLRHPLCFSSKYFRLSDHNDLTVSLRFYVQENYDPSPGAWPGFGSSGSATSSRVTPFSLWTSTSAVSAGAAFSVPASASKAWPVSPASASAGCSS